MVLLIALIALTLWGIIATVIEVRRDGYHPVATDWSRVAGRDVLDRPEAGAGYR